MFDYQRVVTVVQNMINMIQTYDKNRCKKMFSVTQPWTVRRQCSPAGLVPRKNWKMGVIIFGTTLTHRMLLDDIGRCWTILDAENSSFKVIPSSWSHILDLHKNLRWSPVPPGPTSHLARSSASRAPGRQLPRLPAPCQATSTRCKRPNLQIAV